jgi:hypothetical protein
MHALCSYCCRLASKYARGKKMDEFDADIDSLPLVTCASISAQPDPDDPVEILRVLQAVPDTACVLDLDGTGW